jgi:hypothetical protein
MQIHTIETGGELYGFSSQFAAIPGIIQLLMAI